MHKKIKWKEVDLTPNEINSDNRVLGVISIK